MPLAYFHFQNGVIHLDQEGIDLPNLNAVQSEAIATIAAILSEDKVDGLWSGQPLRLWVTDGPDGTGKTLVELELTPE